MTRILIWIRLVDMKRLLAFVLIVLSFTCLSQNLKEVENFGNNPGNLRMFIHIPSNLQGLSPVVFALHGCSQSANELAELSGWNVLADKYGFIVVYPEQNRANNVSNCFNWFSLKDIEGENGELASIRNMSNYVVSNFEIDPAKIFTYGLSAGAAMANSMLANDPSFYSAGAIYAGTPHKSALNAMKAMGIMSHPDDLKPEEWGEFVNVEHAAGNFPKIIVVHGTADNVVDFNNSLELIDQWSFVHGTDAIPDNETKDFAKNSRVNRKAYFNAYYDEVIIFYALKDVKHKLAVNPGDEETQGGETDFFAVDIDFFSTYYIALDFGLIH